MIQFIEAATRFIDQYYLWIYALCGLIILVYLRVFLVARREKSGTIFSLEREIGAQRQARALWAIGGVLAIMVAIAALRVYVIPSVDFAEIAEANTPTPFAIFATPVQPTPTPTEVTPTPTSRPSPTLLRRSPTPSPEPTRPPLPPCPDANARITYPYVGMQLSDTVEIWGTANIPDLQFYKIEYGMGEKPENWASIGEVRRERVVDGVLGTWETGTFPDGVYVIRLTCVDVSGNFPPPCEAQVVLQN